MYQKKNDVLAVKFTVAANAVEVGDVVILSADNTVKKNDAAGSLLVVGTVCQYRTDDTQCVVETRFRERRDDRIIPEANMTFGPFVFDANNKVIAYVAESHSPAAIRGLCLTSATGTGDAVETLEY
jgi:hypothetical protein